MSARNSKPKKPCKEASKRPAKARVQAAKHSSYQQTKPAQGKPNSQRARGEMPLNKVRLVSITEDRLGQRLDNFLIGQLKGAPKSLVYRIVRKGEVRVNKGRVKPEYKLCVGDIVRIPPVKLPEADEIAPVGQGLAKALKDAVLYESDGLMVINKPSGLAVHGGSGINLGMIESLRQVFPDYRFLELVHRLDRDTSGCVMVAKKRSTLRAIHEQLRNPGGIDKIYHTLVAGEWPKTVNQVRAPLLRYTLKSGERMVKVDDEGKPSVTRYRVLEKFAGVSLLEAKPVTGRTHQIRVHCLHMGYPIIGDDKYGLEEANRNQRQQGLKRLFLHAAQLRLTDPSTGQEVVINAPYDPALSNAIQRLNNN